MSTAHPEAVCLRQISRFTASEDFATVLNHLFGQEVILKDRAHSPTQKKVLFDLHGQRPRSNGLVGNDVRLGEGNHMFLIKCHLWSSGQSCFFTAGPGSKGVHSGDFGSQRWTVWEREDLPDASRM